MIITKKELSYSTLTELLAIAGSHEYSFTTRNQAIVIYNQIKHY